MRIVLIGSSLHVLRRSVACGPVCIVLTSASEARTIDFVNKRLFTLCRATETSQACEFSNGETADQACGDRPAVTQHGADELGARAHPRGCRASVRRARHVRRGPAR